MSILSSVATTHQDRRHELTRQSVSSNPLQWSFNPAPGDACGSAQWLQWATLLLKLSLRIPARL